jgi:hypothetical protein
MPAAIRLLRQSDDFLGSVRQANPEDFRFHLAMLAGMFMSRKLRPSVTDIAALESVMVPHAELRELYVLIQEVYNREGQRRGIYLPDQLAKNDQIADVLLQAVRSRLYSTSRKSA